MGNSWSIKRKKLEQDFICEKLKGRIQYFYTHYHGAPDQYGRFAVRVDGKEVLLANPYNEIHYHMYANDIKINEDIPARVWTKKGTIHDAENTKAETSGRKLAIEAGYIDSYDFMPAIDVYLNQSVEKSLWSDDYLVRMFALLDRRIGKRTLLKVRDTYFEQPEWLRYFYKLRYDVEGISLPNTRHFC